MSIKEDIKNTKADKKDLRSFGLIVGGIFAAIGASPVLFGRGVNTLFLVIGLLLVLLGAAAPRLLYWFYRLWMGFAVVMGWIMSRLILMILFYAIITPVGLLTRALGKDFLGIRRQVGAKSYWYKREDVVPPRECYERQF